MKGITLAVKGFVSVGGHVRAGHLVHAYSREGGAGAGGGEVGAKRILSGHISPETAYVVDDYPYGFRLRCKIRYWLDVSKHGVRLMSQTTNPKKPGEVWNKPKASTYAKFGGAMYLDDQDHVTWSALTEYTDGAEASAWRDEYGAGVPDAIRPLTDKWVAAKIAYDAAKVARAGNQEAANGEGEMKKSTIQVGGLAVKGVHQVRPHTRVGKVVRGYTRRGKPFHQSAHERPGDIYVHGGAADSNRHWIARQVGTDIRGEGQYQLLSPKHGGVVDNVGQPYIDQNRAEPRRIATTYSTTTPESAAHGDYADTGWDDEEGQSMEPDEYDLEEKLSAIDKAASFIRGQGSIEASSSHFHSGIWYSTPHEVVDYGTGEERSQSFHLKGFSQEEERMIHEKVLGKKSTSNVAGHVRGGRAVKPYIRSHADAVNFLGKRERKKVGTNTYAERRGDDVAIKYHATDVVTFHKDDTATLRTGGWHTVTTKRRFKQHVPAAGVYQSKGEWHTSAGTPFAEGMRVSTNTGHETHCRKCGGERSFNAKLGAPNPCNCSSKSTQGERVIFKSVETVGGLIGILAHIEEFGIDDAAAHLNEGELQMFETGMKALVAHAADIDPEDLCAEVQMVMPGRPRLAMAVTDRLTGAEAVKGLRLSVGQAAAER